MLAGLDEAGRGPLAGPVYAAAVILPEDFPLNVLDDSKKLDEKKRNAAAALITEKAAWGIAWAEASEIDNINILRASLLAMKRAWEALAEAFPGYARTVSPLDAPTGEESGKTARGGAAGPAGQAATGRAAANETAAGGGLTAVVDGLYCPELPLPCRALVKADARVPEVMAASILAKTARDRMMIHYSWFYPEYGYDRHKGYPTKKHREAILRYGPSPIQRKSFMFKPVQLRLF
ncbi:MAG: ribonuclease HII [Treponema sp.]|nr:ribonuclease HII [Treponema sp.]